MRPRLLPNGRPCLCSLSNPRDPEPWPCKQGFPSTLVDSRLAYFSEVEWQYLLKL